MDDLLACPDLDDGLGGDLHMAAHADLMFEGCDGGAVLGFEEVEVDIEDVLIDVLSEAVVFGFEFGDAGFQICFLAFESGEEVFDFVAFFGVGFFGGSDLRHQFLDFLHEIEFAVFEGGDGFFGSLDFMGEGRVFLVSARLELLLFVAGDGIALCACFHLEVTLLDLDFLRTGFGLLELGRGVGELLFARLAFFWQVGDFGLKASKALVAVLQGEQLFDHIKHLQMMIGPFEIIQRAVCKLQESLRVGKREERS